MQKTKQWKMLVKRTTVWAFIALNILLANPTGFAADNCMDQLQKEEVESKDFHVFSGEFKKLKGIATERECIKIAEDELLNSCKKNNFKRCTVLGGSYAKNGSVITPSRICAAKVLGTNHQTDKQFFVFMKNRCEKIDRCELEIKKQNGDYSLFWSIYKGNYSCNNLEKFLVFSNFKQGDQNEAMSPEQHSSTEKVQ